MPAIIMTQDELYKLLTTDPWNVRIADFFRTIWRKLKSPKWWFDQYQQYSSEVEADRKAIESKARALRLQLPKLEEEKPYAQSLPLPSILDVPLCVLSLDCPQLHEIGMKASVNAERTGFELLGTPDFEPLRTNNRSVPLKLTLNLTLTYQDGRSVDTPINPITITMPLDLRQSPRKMLRDNPVDWVEIAKHGPTYKHDDTQTDTLPTFGVEHDCPIKRLFGASRRGRSHADKALPRDDHFELDYLPESQWYLMAVADGAGSARYSRMGAMLACQTAIETLKAKLADQAVTGPLEQAAAQITQEATQEESAPVRKMLYNILPQAALEARNALIKECQQTASDYKDKNLNVKLADYSTTLLLALAKPIGGSWFVAAFWIGDGAIVLYNDDLQTAHLLGVPDGSSTPSETAFLTSPSMLKDPADILQRVRCCVVDNFTALMLMSDGVSDPLFATEDDLAKPESWEAFCNELRCNNEHPVKLDHDNPNLARELLDYLDFWDDKGTHDDRTLTLLY